MRRDFTAIGITDAEVKALAGFFRNLYVFPTDERKPLRDLLVRVDRYVALQERETAQVGQAAEVGHA